MHSVRCLMPVSHINNFYALWQNDIISLSIAGYGPRQPTTGSAQLDAAVLAVLQPLTMVPGEGETEEDGEDPDPADSHRDEADDDLWEDQEMDAEPSDLHEEQVPPTESVVHLDAQAQSTVDAETGFIETDVTDPEQAKADKKMWEGLTFLMVSI